MKILGISCFYHDSAATLIDNGFIIAAVQEERFTRKKNDFSFPSNSIAYCLEVANLNPQDIDVIVFYEKPLEKFERIFRTFLLNAPKGFHNFYQAMGKWPPSSINFRMKIAKHLEFATGLPHREWIQKIRFSRHHYSHAGSAFFPSPFLDAAVITIDGVGEWETTTIFHGKDRKLELICNQTFPDSLGLLYSAFTHFCGFKVNSGEYKLMGLAPYGRPKYIDLIYGNLISVYEDGSFKINQKYFDYQVGNLPTNKEFQKLFGFGSRLPEAEITQNYMDLAASIQQVIEDVVLKMSIFAYNQTRSRNLCLAGGVALNCVVNGRLLRESPFESIWIQPAAGDAGGSLGAALGFWKAKDNTSMLKKVKESNTDDMQYALLGPEFSEEEVIKTLVEVNANFSILSESELISNCTDALVNGFVVGWFQGRLEFGPRALGSRSILADPRSPEMQIKLNQKTKFRELFRPFAPIILEEYIENWFDLTTPSPYMLFTTKLKDEKRFMNPTNTNVGSDILELPTKKSIIPAVTHVDFSARVQSVNEISNPKIAKLLRSFYSKTGVPILVNTSFNVRGEPLVLSPLDAFSCFMHSGIDVLAIGNCLLYKQDQQNYTSKTLRKFEDD